MSTFSEILNRGVRKAVPNVGKAYDVATGVGSFVTSGIEAYRTISEEVKEVSRFLGRFSDLGKDPQSAYYLVNSLLRPNPIPIADHMSTTNSVKKILNFLKGNPSQFPYTIKGYMNIDSDGRWKDDLAGILETRFDLYDKSKVNSLFDQNSVLGPKFNSNPDIKFADKTEYYTKLNSPYSQKIANSNNPIDSIAWATETLGATIGYHNWKGYSIGTDHIWDIKIKPYRKDESFETFTPELPVIDIFTWETSGDSLTLNRREFNFSETTPVISYQLNYGTSRKKDIPLYNESSISMPLGMSYQNYISVTIADDQDRSMFKYMNKYYNAIQDPSEYTIAPYDQAAFEIQLIVFKPGYKVNFQFKFICVPMDYAPLLEGSDSPNATDIKIDFQIIGMRKYTNDKEVETYKNSSEWSKTTWKDVTIKP